jgi:hypothetical protein
MIDYIMQNSARVCTTTAARNTFPENNCKRMTGFRYFKKIDHLFLANLWQAEHHKICFCNFPIN